MDKRSHKCETTKCVQVLLHAQGNPEGWYESHGTTACSLSQLAPSAAFGNATPIFSSAETLVVLPAGQRHLRNHVWLLVELDSGVTHGQLVYGCAELRHHHWQEIKSEVVHCKHSKSDSVDMNTPHTVCVIQAAKGHHATPLTARCGVNPVQQVGHHAGPR